MKIALIGYGKMGKTIERVALNQGHEVVLIIDVNNIDEMTKENLQKADVAIEFTRPESAFSNISTCIKAGIPIVSGTTGWLDNVLEIHQLCDEYNGAFFYASNFSIGVNIFFEMNRFLSSMMSSHIEYEPSLEEIHHTEKLDAPSGTGITLAEGVLKHIHRKTKWVNRLSTSPEELALTSQRLENVPGTHTVTYDSPIDTIEIKHTAHSREGFAQGAVMAAEWVIGKKGTFNMRQLLGFDKYNW